ATFHPRQSGITFGLKLLSLGPLLILIMLIAVVSLITPAFLKPVNLGNILAQTAVIAVVAMGQQLVILTRGIDLSVGSNLALATVIGGLVYQHVDSSIVVIIAMLLAGAAIGAVN
ncbi:ABC transporter permease, partial [Rhizobium ruizarguesonis]